MLTWINFKNEHMINTSGSPSPNINANKKRKKPNKEARSVQFDCSHHFD